MKTILTAAALLCATSAGAVSFDFADLGYEGPFQGLTVDGVTVTGSPGTYADGYSGGRPAGLGWCVGACAGSALDNIGPGDPAVELTFSEKVRLTGFEFRDGDHYLLNGKVAVNGATYSVLNGLIDGWKPDAADTTHSFGYVDGDPIYLRAATVAAVPLPAGLALMLTGIAALGLVRRKG